MIRDINFVNTYIHYKRSRGPFVILFYKPNDPNNKKLYNVLKELCKKYQDVPLLRFDWKSFKREYPNEMPENKNLLIIENSAPNRVANTININEIKEILQTVREKRYQYLKSSNKDFKSYTRKKMRAWKPYGRCFSFKETTKMPKNYDEYIFPNLSSHFSNKEFLKKRLETNLRRKRYKSYRSNNQIIIENNNFYQYSNNSNNQPIIQKFQFNSINPEKIFLLQKLNENDIDSNKKYLKNTSLINHHSKISNSANLKDNLNKLDMQSTSSNIQNPLIEKYQLDKNSQQSYNLISKFTNAKSKLEHDTDIYNNQNKQKNIGIIHPSKNSLNKSFSFIKAQNIVQNNINHLPNIKITKVIPRTKLEIDESAINMSTKKYFNTNNSKSFINEIFQDNDVGSISKSFSYGPVKNIPKDLTFKRELKKICCEVGDKDKPLDLTVLKQKE